MSYDVIASQPIVIDNVRSRQCERERERLSLTLVCRDLVLSRLGLLERTTQRFTSTASECGKYI